MTAVLHGAPIKPLNPDGDANSLCTSAERIPPPTMISATTDEPLHGEYPIYNTPNPLR